MRAAEFSFTVNLKKNKSVFNRNPLIDGMPQTMLQASWVFFFLHSDFPQIKTMYIVIDVVWLRFNLFFVII